MAPSLDEEVCSEADSLRQIAEAFFVAQVRNQIDVAMHRHT